MKKIISLAITGVSSVLLGACTEIPQCLNQDMDKCGHGTIYSEERTFLGSQKPAEPEPVVAQPAPEPVAAPAPVETPVIAPDDTPIMTKADEPNYTK